MKIGLFIIFILQIFGCYTQISQNPKKDKIYYSDADFCTLIDQGKFEDTGQIINRFLLTLNENDTNEKNLELLCKWLEEKECIVKAELIRDILIDTMPPLMEINVQFKLRNRIFNMILDIELGSKLKYYNWHN